MHIAILNQYFPPDLAPTGQMAHDLAEFLVDAGHEVRVFCGQPRSVEGERRTSTMEGLMVTAIWASPFGTHFLTKLLHYLSFYVNLGGHLLCARPKPDVILAMTTPPYLGLLARWVARLRGIESADWVMDLYPDVLAAHGSVKKEGVVWKGLAALSRGYLRQSRAVFALGPDMADSLKVYTERSRIVEVPLWTKALVEEVSCEAIQEYRAEREWGDDTVFLYSGNLGLGHDFETFCQAIRYRGPRAPGRWVFCGRGARRDEVISKVRGLSNYPVEWLDHVPANRLEAHLASAQVHLASLDPQWAGLLVPSKLQAAFGMGKPVLAVVPERSSIGSWIQESGGGWQVKPGDWRALIKAVEQALEPSERERRGRLAADYAAEQFDPIANQALMERHLGGGVVRR